MKKNIWKLIRAATFILVGIINTILIRPEDIGTWKNYLGYLLLILGAIDLIIFLKKRIAMKQKKEER